MGRPGGLHGVGLSGLSRELQAATLFLLLSLQAFPALVGSHFSLSNGPHRSSLKNTLQIRVFVRGT